MRFPDLGDYVVTSKKEKKNDNIEFNDNVKAHRIRCCSFNVISADFSIQRVQSALYFLFSTISNQNKADTLLVNLAIVHVTLKHSLRCSVYVRITNGPHTP